MFSCCFEKFFKEIKQLIPASFQVYILFLKIIIYSARKENRKEKDGNIYFALVYRMLLLYLYIYKFFIHSKLYSPLIHIPVARYMIHVLFFSASKVLKMTLYRTCIGPYLPYATVYGVS